MTGDRDGVRQVVKVARIWRRACAGRVILRIHYELWQERGCTIYCLSRVEEPDSDAP
jgi:hypothetical protein